MNIIISIEQKKLNSVKYYLRIVEEQLVLKYPEIKQIIGKYKDKKINLNK